MMTSHTPHNQAGVILIESLLAILIFAIGVLALVGFQATAIKESEANRQRTEASFIANQIIGDLWARDPANIAASAGDYDDDSSAWGKRVVEALPNGNLNVTVAGSTVTVTITWVPPDHNPDEPRTYTQTTQIVGST